VFVHNSAKGARDSEFQALLPIRGKILNAAKASTKAVLDNAECAGLITAIGGGAGRNFDLDSVRYGRVVTLCDADVDGAHIRTLLLTFFYHWMRPLLAAGRIYSAIPPLFEIPVRGQPARFAYSDAERDSILAELSEKGINVNADDIKRYKGLGEMNPEQLATTTMDPDTRRLRRVRLRDAEAAAAAFDVLMGSVVEPRRRYIEEHSDLFDRDKLDL
jgi:DNA gyrase subunit B